MSEAKALTVPQLEEPPMPSLNQLLSLLDVCRFMSLEKNIDKLLSYIADQGRKALNADRCSIFLLDEEQNEIWSKVQLGESHIIRFPKGAGIAGRSIASGQTILIPDAYNSPHFNPAVDRATGYRTRNILCVPLNNLDGKSIGCLQLLNKQDGDFKPADEAFTMAFASQAAVAIESVFLHEEKARIIEQLAEANAGLEQKVNERTQALAATNAETQEILDNLDDGILLINKHLKIESRFSPATPAILGIKDLAHNSIKDLLFSQLDPLQVEASQHNFTLPMLFGADDLQWSMSRDYLLKTMSYNRPAADAQTEIRQLSLRYAPLYNGQGNIEHILLVISDVTEVLALRRIIEESKNSKDQHMQMVMEILQADRQILLSFMQETATRSQVIRDAILNLKPEYPLTVLQAIFREVHTFKGNARMVKLQSLSREAHQLEDTHAALALSGDRVEEAQSEAMIQALEQMLSLAALYQQTWQELFGAKPGADIKSKLRQEFLDILQSGLAIKNLVQLLEAQNRQEIFSFAEVWLSFQSMVDDIAPQLGKELEPLQIQGNIFLHSALQSAIKDALTHLLRNALDHGIETPEQRVSLGKTGVASLRLDFAVCEDQLHLDLSDDGRGVDCDKVWSLAQERGIIAPGAVKPADAEVMELLFYAGFSTKSAASDISGRGVGLDAVRSFLGEFSCRVEISSQRGLGTCFRLIIPLTLVTAAWNGTGPLWGDRKA